MPSALARAWRLLELAYGVSGHDTGGRRGERASAIDYARPRRRPRLEMRLHASAAHGRALWADAGRRGHRDRARSCWSSPRATAARRATTLGGARAPPGHARRFRARARDDYRRGRAILEELGLALRRVADVASIRAEWSCWPATPWRPRPSSARTTRRSTPWASGTTSRRSRLAGRSPLPPGRFEEAAAFRQVLRGGRGRSDVYSQYLWRGIRGKLLARDGAHDEGIELARRASSRLGRPTTSRAGQRARVPGRGEGCRRPIRRRHASRRREACELFETKGNVISARRVDELVSRRAAIPRSRPRRPA